MKSFEEMWKNAMMLGANLEECAEMLYDSLKNQEREETLQNLLNLVAEIKGFLQYLEDEKGAKADITKINHTIKNHRHETDGEVYLPMEIDC